MYTAVFKRLIDIVMSLLVMVMLSPIFLAIALFIVLESRGGVFFKQERLGKGGQVFKIIKFRTMIKGAEKIGTGLFTDGNDSRITKVGTFLRKYSLDEIPQLINILKGDMSIIGPRPPVPYHPYKYNEYPEQYKVRFLIKPGVSGWAQVNGRTNISWPQRLELDKYYVDSISFIFDLKILFLTALKIIKRDNIYPEDINIGKKDL